MFRRRRCGSGKPLLLVVAHTRTYIIHCIDIFSCIYRLYIYIYSIYLNISVYMCAVSKMVGFHKAMKCLFRTSIPSRLTCATSLHFRAGWGQLLQGLVFWWKIPLLIIAVGSNRWLVHGPKQATRCDTVTVTTLTLNSLSSLGLMAHWQMCLLYTFVYQLWRWQS